MGGTQVAIVGAGIAGLVTAKTLNADGFDVRVFDKVSELGGTWIRARTYPGLRTNNSKRTYEFSDHAFPDSVGNNPTAEEVRAYLNSYVDRFGLRDCFSFDTEVTKIERDGDGFAVSCRPVGSDDTASASHFDRVVVCNGIFQAPYLPRLNGQEQFAGRILHSSQVDASTFEAGRKLVVVGGGKSAYDIAEEAGRRGIDVTIVVRSPQWRAPRYDPDGNPGDYPLYTRQLHSLMPFYSDSADVLEAKTALKDECFQTWLGLSEGFKGALGMPDALVPDEALPAGLVHLAAGGDLFELVGQGRVRVARSGVAGHSNSGIVLESGETLDCDEVVFATGWQRDYGFLGKELQELLIDAEDRLTLYRNMVPLEGDGIAFNGHASSFSCTLSAEICAHWISEYFLGRVSLPAREEMQADIDLYRAWADEWIGGRACDAFIGPFQIPYVLGLLAEIDGGAEIVESFGDDVTRPLLPHLFGGLAEARAKQRSAA